MRREGGGGDLTVCAKEVEGLVGSSVGEDMKDDCLVPVGSLAGRGDVGDGRSGPMTLRASPSIQKVCGRAADQEDTRCGIEDLVALDVLEDV